MRTPADLLQAARPLIGREYRAESGPVYIYDIGLAVGDIASLGEAAICIVALQAVRTAMRITIWLREWCAGKSVYEQQFAIDAGCALLARRAIN